MVRILVVEQNAFLREVYGEVLELNDYEVYKAGSGHEALRLLRDSQLTIDLVISNLTLPDMDAGVLYDALEEVQQVKMLVLVRDPTLEEAVVLTQRPGIRWSDKRLSVEEFGQVVRDVLAMNG